MSESLTDRRKNAPCDAGPTPPTAARAHGRHFWRSLEELAGTDAFVDALHREFPAGAAEWLNTFDPDSGEDRSYGHTRRDFLSLMGASIALAGVGGCIAREPQEAIVPYVNQPEEVVPGKPLYFATVLPINGFAQGVIVQSREGRPIKIEGNPDHPATLGAASAQMQASILSLYDPDRSQVVVNADSTSTWDAFLRKLGPVLDNAARNNGRGLRVLTEPVLSPTLAAQAAALKQKFPQMRWHQWSALDRNNARTAATRAFGQSLSCIHHFDRADVVLALDSDFLFDEPASLRYSRQFMDRRRVRSRQRSMNRLYVIESTVTITGAMADHRQATTPDQVEALARAIAAALGVPGVTAAPASSSAPDVPQDWIDALIADLRQAGKSALVIAGPCTAPSLHGLCHAINAALDAFGTTVTLTEPVEAGPVDTTQSLAELVADMNAGAVESLFILGGNPVYAVPGDLNFTDALSKVPFRARLGEYDDETSFLCHWHIPQAHTLEQWSDARAFDGTASIVQPLIAPLYGGKSSHEFIAALLGDTTTSARELVRATWRARNDIPEFESMWKQWLHDGVIAGTAAAATAREAKPSPRSFARSAPTTEPATGQSGTIQLVFRPDPSVLDGFFANNGWLQELPKPISKLTWENAALLAPATARRFGIEDGTVVAIGQVRAPALLVPGHPRDVITLHLGYGRRRSGRVGNKLGFDVRELRTSTSPWQAEARLALAGGTAHTLARTQQHQLMEGRDLLRVSDISAYGTRAASAHGSSSDHPDHGANGHRSIPLDLYAPWDYSQGNQWAMVIDNNACIGCNACVVACQSENNIPVVGKDQVARGREMHWLRIDTYFSAAPESAHATLQEAAEHPETYFQPVPCMHCEQAPCEVVCPVGATVHDAEGTNNMVYNRCIGTRYCSNNCPYKVRRFNWLAFTKPVEQTPSLRLLQNPDVTVRSRGVMEKCTYCIQRIDRARIDAKRQDRPFGMVLDGEIQSACQQSCPTQAITFGNLNAPGSRVAQLRNEPTNYGMLEELNTKPRTTYLERFRNPNPALKQKMEPRMNTDEHG